jgi:hypothetical protein
MAEHHRQHARRARYLHHILTQHLVLSGEQILHEIVTTFIGIARGAGEMMIDSHAGRSAEIIRNGKNFTRVIRLNGFDPKNICRKWAKERGSFREHQRVGRGAGLGRGLGVEVGLGVPLGVPVGVGDGDALPSYSSALLRTLLEPSPAATSTMPLDNNVAVCLSRAALRLSVTVQLPFAGSYNSALAKTPVLPTPAATSAVPFGSNVAV